MSIKLATIDSTENQKIKNTLNMLHQKINKIEELHQKIMELKEYIDELGKVLSKKDTDK